MEPDSSAAGAAKTAVAAGGGKDVLPDGQFELATLAETAADAWDGSPLPGLLWCPKTKFREMAVAYRASVGTADEADDALSPTAERLRELDRETSAGITFVIGYLKDKYGREVAKGYYDEFGFKGGRFATARPKRAKQLPKLLAALVKHGFDKNKYGTAFWQPLAAEYAPLAKTSSGVRQDTSSEVGKKNVQEKPLRKALRALRLSIRANFPDTYEAELRHFGFLAESF